MGPWAGRQRRIHGCPRERRRSFLTREGPTLARVAHRDEAAGRHARHLIPGQVVLSLSEGSLPTAVSNHAPPLSAGDEGFTETTPWQLRKQNLLSIRQGGPQKQSGGRQKQSNG